MDIYSNTEIRQLKNFCEKLKIADSENIEQTFQEFFNFLSNEKIDDYLILYASVNHVFINSVLMSLDSKNDNDISELLKWSGSSDNVWSQSCTMDCCELQNPMENYGSPIFSRGEPLFFLRSMDGVKDYEFYVDFNQKITQSLGLHFIHEKSAWCRLNQLGDLEEVIKFKNFSLDENSLYILYIQKETLEEYCTLTNQFLLRMIDFTILSENYSGWQFAREKISINQNGLIGHLEVEDNIGGFFRGIQIVESTAPMKSLVDKAWDIEHKEYVELIVNDIKFNKVHSISCHPDKLDNYFVDTGKPLAMSIAFFNPEVLRKYKSDSDKYIIEGRSITCRGSWWLKSFDVNQQNQVSVYLVDFNRLPYNEQLHWKQYNEKPKGFISERAVKNDFLGEFCDETRNIEILKTLLKEFQKNNCNWWTLRSDDNLSKLQMPLTESKDEWAEEILNLDKLIIEGLEEKKLKIKGKSLGVNIEDKDRSLKIIEKILIHKGFELSHAREIMSVFHEVHNLRSTQKGHSSGNTADIERKEILKKYESFTNHFDFILAKMIESLEILENELK